MSSPGSYPPCSLEFHPAPVHGWIALVIVAVSVFALAVFRTEPVFDDLAILISLTMLRRAIDTALLREPAQARRLVGHADGQWTLVLNDERRVNVTWQPGMLHAAGLVAGTVTGEGRRFDILATPWNSAAGPRRRLAVRLRWTPAAELWSR